MGMIPGVDNEEFTMILCSSFSANFASFLGLYANSLEVLLFWWFSNDMKLLYFFELSTVASMLLSNTYSNFKFLYFKNGFIILFNFKLKAPVDDTEDKLAGTNSFSLSSSFFFLF